MGRPKASRKRHATHCVRGHERTADNIDSRGECMPCKRAREAARYCRGEKRSGGGKSTERALRVWEAEVALERAIALESWSPLMPWERPGWQLEQP